MKVAAQCIDLTSETFDTKRGQKTLHILVMLDVSKPSLRNTFDYELQAAELPGAAGLVGKELTLEIRDITQSFSGRIRMQGAIVVD